MKLSKYILFTPASTNCYLVYSYISGNMFTIDKATFTYLNNNNFSYIPDEILQSLKKSNILIDKNKDQELFVSDSTNILNIVILPNNKCNLRCKYCGEKKGNESMTVTTQKSLVAFVRKKLQENSYKVLDVDFFGGEPTLDIHIIQELSKQLILLANEFKCVYKAKIVTNGILLTKENCNILINDCCIDFFEITIDGSKQFNDNRRVNKLGQGFYNEIMNNIEYLYNFNCIISIRCNVDKYNADGIYPLLMDFKRRRMSDKIRFYIASIHAWGTEDGTRSISLENFAKLEIEVFKILFAYNFPLSNYNLLPARKQVRECVAQNENAYIIDAFGNIYTCSETPYTGDSNAIIGHINTGITKDRQLFRFSETQKQICLQCSIYPVCGGGCIKRAGEQNALQCITLLKNQQDRCKLLYKLSKKNVCFLKIVWKLYFFLKYQLSKIGKLLLSTKNRNSSLI